MPEEFEFFADPMCQGRITPRALMTSTGTISVPLVVEMMQRKIHGRITRLAGAGWFFNIGYTSGKFVVQRNDSQIAIDEKWCRGKELPPGMLVSWTLDALILSFGDHNTHWNYPQLIDRAPAVAPPPELVRWVRKHELSP